jgi:hypothetical protein
MNLFILIAALIALGSAVAEPTNTNELYHVGPYNVSFSLPGVRDFDENISGPTTFKTWKGITGTDCNLDLVDQNTGESINISFIKWDTPIANDAYKNILPSENPAWFVQSVYGDCPIFWNIIHQYRAWLVRDEYTLIFLRSDMSRTAFAKFVVSLRVD